MKRSRALLTICFAVMCGVAAGARPQTPQQTPPAPSQAPAAPAPGRGGGRGGPAVVSPQIESDGRVTFRVLAPNATTVTVGGDINGSLVPDANAAPQPATPGAQAGRGGGPAAVILTKGENGIWSGTTVRPVRPGAWRYTFNVDGVDGRGFAQRQRDHQPDTSAEHAVCAGRFLGNAGRAAWRGRYRALRGEVAWWRAP